VVYLVQVAGAVCGVSQSVLAGDVDHVVHLAAAGNSTVYGLTKAVLAGDLVYLAAGEITS
jgi:hypothetical protein